MVQQVAESYVGPAKVQRLLFIAEHSDALRPSALRLAMAELLASSNTLLYAEVLEKRLGEACVQLGLVRDGAWIESVEKRTQQQGDRLELELSSAKTSLAKEAIRTCHNALGDFHAEKGDFGAALKSYVRARDYCTTAKHVVSMCVNVVKASVLMGSYTHVLTYVTKAEQTTEADEPLALSRLQACAGLAHLEVGKYKLAARKLSECTTDLCFPELLLPRDVALCGGLCALASLDRAELRTLVIDAHAFRTLLELVPNLRDAVHTFHEAKYAECLKALDLLKPELLLNPHLRAHAEKLLALVRTKAVVSYFLPYATVDMGRMAAAFSTELPAFEKELVSLITDGTIGARIDSANKVLIAQGSDQQQISFNKAQKMGDAYTYESKALLLRINLLRADLVVRAEQGAGHGQAHS